MATKKGVTIPVKDQALFRANVPLYMKRLREDFDLSLDDACAFMGNAGQESGGFKFMQEKKPLVPGSAGGLGPFQWTGPRRKRFEAWLTRVGKTDNPADFEACYGYLYRELSGAEAAHGLDYRHIIPGVKATKGFNAKVIYIREKFEAPAVHHDADRVAWAVIAKDEWLKRYPSDQGWRDQPKPPVTPPTPPVPAPADDTMQKAAALMAAWQDANPAARIAFLISITNVSVESDA